MTRSSNQPNVPRRITQPSLHTANRANSSDIDTSQYRLNLPVPKRTILNNSNNQSIILCIVEASNGDPFSNYAGIKGGYSLKV